MFAKLVHIFSASFQFLTQFEEQHLINHNAGFSLSHLRPAFV